MLEAVKNVINCDLSNELLKQPVVLPCGGTVCGKHQALFKNKETARCQICDEDHELSGSGHFPANKKVARLLEAEISRLDFGENYKQGLKLLQELKNVMTKYDEVKNKVVDLIFEKFQEMRRKVYLIREQIIQKVNECSEKIISDIDSYRQIVSSARSIYRN